MTHHLINGISSDTITIQDRGLLFGDGLFETIRVNPKGLILWEHHWQRLQKSCARLAIECPSEALVLTEIGRLLQDTSNIDNIVKLTITRGRGTRGYRINPETPSSRIVSCYELPKIDSSQYQGIHTEYLSTPLSENPLLAGMKHLNRLDQVMANIELDARNLIEGLMLDSDQNIIEGTRHNVFFKIKGQWLTPEVSKCGIDGVMRNYLLQQHQRDIVIKDKLHIDTIQEIQSGFFCNSVYGIIPIRSIDSHSLDTNDEAIQAFTASWNSC